MILINILKTFYETQRLVMENNNYYLIGSIIIAVFLYFFSSKSAFLSLFPIVSSMVRFLGEIYSDNEIVNYLTDNFLRFIITSYVVTYILIYFTKLSLKILAAIALLSVTHKYNEYLNVSFYKYVMITVVAVTFYSVGRLQKVCCVLIAAFYSSLIILNGIEILSKYKLGMKNLELEGLALSFMLTAISLFLQTRIHRKKAK
ncbi:hypothetical protein AAJ76_3800017796 [Vairimorpha ceranae]|uniref:Uncharacterized protein n=1 Tax=Vairimorpha ceranae TaxID=40302 RepID=A0A0F9YQY1_9MICR|nr:hypothetical protein AAJ76_3800017796 [Vairimorpha ceranae]KAF5140272.1 hypothetical protein G9O61_00g015280 [Vairimorpha ceranae]KKO74937.1 hypothetical protein AAJ76_3800017796 [Vairimorpha ceranae]